MTTIQAGTGTLALTAAFLTTSIGAFAQTASAPSTPTTQPPQVAPATAAPTSPPAKDQPPKQPVDKAQDKSADSSAGDASAPPSQPPSKGNPASPEAPPAKPPQPNQPPHPALPPGHPPLKSARPGGARIPRWGLRRPPLRMTKPPVPLAPPALFPTQLEEEDNDVEVVGVHEGRVFIRAPHDRIRIYPGMRLRLDYYNALNPPPLAAEDGAANLGPRFALRRLRFDMSGELFRRVFFTAGIELGGGRVGDTVYTGPDTKRFSMPSAHDGKLLPAEVSVSYKFRPWLNLTLGQFNVPFSMSNRTREEALPWLERDIATRGMAVPNVKDIGMSLWGDVLAGDLLTYELGIFTGDGAERPGADQLPEFIGRVFARPLRRLGSSTFFQRAQVGLSGRFGSRDHRGFVTYDYPAVATNNGFVLWQPGYVDSLDRVVRVIPSGRQSALGGELRLPFDLPGGRALDLRGEAYYVDNNTREAVEGFEATNSERFGRVRSIGWYAQASFWCCGDAFIQEAPGRYRPVTVDLAHARPQKRGLEVQLLASSIMGSYDGASRQGSTPDANTPTANFSVYQLGGGIQYHHGRNFRTLLHYFAYLTPDSASSASNLAQVPSNLNGGSSISHHELSARMAVTF